MKVQLKQIIFTKINTAELLDVGEFDSNDLLPNQVMIKTEISTISSGTEKANVAGDPSVSSADKPNVSFPRSVGYSSAGYVVAIGSAVKSVKVGDKAIATWQKHKNYNICDEKYVVKMDDDMDFTTGALAMIATFPLAGIRKTRLEFGESCIVMGLGILGQLAVKLARASGANPVIAVDYNEERRAIAEKNGADYSFSPADPDFVQKIKQVTGGGAKVAIEITGRGEGLDMVLDCMARFGRVALVGCTRNSDFSIDYYRKVHGPGVSLIGAHTMARPKEESSAGLFTDRDDINSVLKACKMGRFTISDLIAEVVSPKDCFEIYTRLVEGKNYPICVQFDWNKLD